MLWFSPCFLGSGFTDLIFECSVFSTLTWHVADKSVNIFWIKRNDLVRYTNYMNVPIWIFKYFNLFNQSHFHLQVLCFFLSLTLTPAFPTYCLVFQDSLYLIYFSCCKLSCSFMLLCLCTYYSLCFYLFCLPGELLFNFQDPAQMIQLPRSLRRLDSKPFPIWLSNSSSGTTFSL